MARLFQCSAALACAFMLQFAITAPANAQAFEVISVKPNPLAPGRMMFRFNMNNDLPAPHIEGNRFIERQTTLQDLLTLTWSLRDYQVIGLPAWAQSPSGDHFYVEGKAPGDATPTSGQLRAMLKDLIAERFQFEAHMETRDLPVYALVVAKGGVKIRQLRPDETPNYAFKPVDGAVRTGAFGTLILSIGTAADRPVIDETGLTGLYEYEDPGFRLINLEKKSDPINAQSMLAEAVERLGLKLEARKQKTPVLVVDHVQPPIAN